jgi:hypothetical protein
MRPYLEGVEVVGFDPADSRGFPDGFLFSGPVNMGRGAYSGAQFLPGMIDEVRIWNVSLTGSEIAAGMATERRGDELGLVRYYPFGAQQITTEGTDRYAADLSPQGDPARLSSAATIQASGPVLNRVPSMAPIADASVPLGSELHLDLVATDPDSDALTYTVVGHPSGAQLTGNHFSWRPAPAQLGAPNLGDCRAR